MGLGLSLLHSRGWSLSDGRRVSPRVRSILDRRGAADSASPRCLEGSPRHERSKARARGVSRERLEARMSGVARQATSESTDMTRPRVLLDVDGVLCDFLTPFLAMINEHMLMQKLWDRPRRLDEMT